MTRSLLIVKREKWNIGSAVRLKHLQDGQSFAITLLKVIGDVDCAEWKYAPWEWDNNLAVL